jgi:hypothetical protein
LKPFLDPKEDVQIDPFPVSRSVRKKYGRDRLAQDFAQVQSKGGESELKFVSGRGRKEGKG